MLFTCVHILSHFSHWELPHCHVSFVPARAVSPRLRRRSLEGRRIRRVASLASRIQEDYSYSCPKKSQRSSKIHKVQEITWGFGKKINSDNERWWKIHEDTFFLDVVDYCCCMGSTSVLLQVLDRQPSLMAEVPRCRRITIFHNFPNMLLPFWRYLGFPMYSPFPNIPIKHIITYPSSETFGEFWHELSWLSCQSKVKLYKMGEFCCNIVANFVKGSSCLRILCAFWPLVATDKLEDLEELLVMFKSVRETTETC